METLLLSLCEKHGLTGILVHLLNVDTTRPFVSIALHWDDGNRECCNGSGNTFDAAFAEALPKMAKRRTARAA